MGLIFFLVIAFLVWWMLPYLVVMSFFKIVSYAYRIVDFVRSPARLIDAFAKVTLVAILVLWVGYLMNPS